MRVAEPVPGGHVVQALQVGDDLLEHLFAAQRAHVADVRRDDDAPVPGERDGELQVAANREYRLRQLARQLELERRDAAAEPDRTRAARGNAHHRVVGRPDDRPVVVQERIGDRREPRFGLAPDR